MQSLKFCRRVARHAVRAAHAHKILSPEVHLTPCQLIRGKWPYQGLAAQGRGRLLVEWPRETCCRMAVEEGIHPQHQHFLLLAFSVHAHPSAAEKRQRRRLPDTVHRSTTIRISPCPSLLLIFRELAYFPHSRQQWTFPSRQRSNRTAPQNNSTQSDIRVSHGHKARGSP